MAFISERAQREIMQDSVPDNGAIAPEWSDVFDASVGFAIDEGLSTSRMLNNEGFEQRSLQAKQLFDSGVNRDEYTDRRGQIDYDYLARRYEGIKTDQELQQEKRLILAKKREYYNDIMSRSQSGSAEFLGSVTGYMTDPINLSTMAVGTPFAVAKGVGVLGKILMGGAGAAVINAGTEALIQPFVLDYKLEIGSPYGVEDAITNIAMAAGGGFVFGGAVGGISGWLGKIKNDALKSKIPEGVDVEEVKLAVDQIDDMIETLKSNPEVVDVQKLKESTSSKKELDEAINKEQIELDKKYLQRIEAERNKANETSKIEPIENKLIDDEKIVNAYRGIENPVISDGERMVDATKTFDELDADVEGLELLKGCLVG